MKILPGMLFLGFQLSFCLALRWFSKIREKSPKFKILKVVFIKIIPNISHIMKMQVVSQSMSSKCINNSKLNSYAFKSSKKIL